MFKFLKRSIFILLICILIFAVSSAIWFLFPQRNIDSLGLLSDGCLIYGNFKIVAEDVTLDFIENNLLKLNRHNDFQKKLFRIALKLTSPINITAVLDCTPNSKKPDYLIIVKGKMVNKAARIGARGFDLYNLIKKRERKVVFGFLGNVMLVSNKSEIIEKSIEQYSKKPAKIRNVLLEKIRKASIFFYIANSNMKFSNFTHAMEKKSSYVFFPTIDYVRSIEIQVGIKDKNTAEGKILLFSTDSKKQAELRNDLNFLLEALKRVALAYQLKLAYAIEPYKSKDLIARLKLERSK